MTKRILAIGHDACRAGAQISFLDILGWLRQHHDADISLVLKAGGELLDDYADVLPTRVLPPGATSKPASVLGRIRHGIRTRGAGLDLDGVDLIYANTTASAGLAADLAARAPCPVICHVHELEMSIRRFTGLTRFRRAQPHLDRFIAVSQAVERNLIENHGIERGRIDRIPPGISLRDHTGVSHDRSEITTALGIPPDAFVVGGCGTTDWRKAPDLFLLVARSVAARQPERPVHFVWVGAGETASLEMLMLQHDLDRLGLGGGVHFVGPQSDPMRYFARFDVFLLTSREDPFPLVCLEAASLGVPTVCFDGAGGMPEFVEDDAGFVVPYLDIEGAADRLLVLAGSECTRSAMGRRAAEKVAERCSMDVVGPQIAAALDRCLP